MNLKWAKMNSFMSFKIKHFLNPLCSSSTSFCLFRLDENTISRFKSYSLKRRKKKDFQRLGIAKNTLQMLLSKELPNLYITQKIHKNYKPKLKSSLEKENSLEVLLGLRSKIHKQLFFKIWRNKNKFSNRKIKIMSNLEWKAQAKIFGLCINSLVIKIKNWSRKGLVRKL